MDESQVSVRSDNRTRRRHRRVYGSRWCDHLPCGSKTTTLPLRRQGVEPAEVVQEPVARSPQTRPLLTARLSAAASWSDQ